MPCFRLSGLYLQVGTIFPLWRLNLCPEGAYRHSRVDPCLAFFSNSLFSRLLSGFFLGNPLTYLQYRSVTFFVFSSHFIFWSFFFLGYNSLFLDF